MRGLRGFPSRALILVFGWLGFLTFIPLYVSARSCEGVAGGKELPICQVYGKHIHASSVHTPALHPNAVIEGFRVRRVLYIGGDTAMGIYSATLRIARGETGYVAYEPLYKENIERVGLGRALFKWAPLAANVTTSLSEKHWHSLRKKVDAVVVSVGLRDLRDNKSNAEKDFSDLISTVAGLSNPDSIPFIFLSLPLIKDECLDQNSTQDKEFRDDEGNLFSLFMERESERLSATKPWFLFSNIRFGRDRVFGEDGFRSTLVDVTVSKALILSFPLIAPYDGNSATVGTAAAFLFLGALLGVAFLCEMAVLLSNKYSRFSSPHRSSSLQESVVGLFTSTGARKKKDMDEEEGGGGDGGPPTSQQKEHKTASNSLLFVIHEAYQKHNGRSVAVALATYFCVLLLFAIVDGPFRTTVSILKQHSADGLYACGTLAFLFAITRLRATKSEDLTPGSLSLQTLNREQTEEWKGWMMAVFLLYHYFSVTEVYNPVRVMVASFVFLSGYGNACFFMKKKDFSPLRVLKVILRINLFVTFVCLVLNKPYILYYICALHTYMFFVVYITFLPLKFSPSSARAPAALCLALSFCALVVLDSFPWTKEVLFFPLERILQNENGSMHEWYFRESLDHYVVWFGMLIAFLVPEWNKFLARVEGFPLLQKVIWRGLIVGAALLLLWFNYDRWLGNPDRYEYNRHHAYVSYMPILVYIVLRNLTSKMRSVVLSPFASLGTATLETYIAQCHIFMTDDAKSWLVVFEGYPILSFVLSGLLMIWVSYHTLEATQKLIAAVAPSGCSFQAVLLRVSLCLGAFIGCYMASAVLVFSVEVVEAVV